MYLVTLSVKFVAYSKCGILKFSSVGCHAVLLVVNGLRGNAASI